MYTLLLIKKGFGKSAQRTKSPLLPHLKAELKIRAADNSEKVKITDTNLSFFNKSVDI